MTSRTDALAASLADIGLDGLLLTNIKNVRYLSGFTGDSALALVLGDRRVLITDGRFREQASLEASGWELVIWKEDLYSIVAGQLGAGARVGFESGITYGFHARLASAVDPSVTLIPAVDAAEKLRSVKDHSEIEAIGAALRCALEAFAIVEPMIAPGASEREIAAELDYRMRLAGSEGPGFDTVIASGPNSSMPHAGITDRAIGEGDLVVVDFGATVAGYHSDTTRTLTIGQASPRQKEILDAVAAARAAAIEALSPGMPAKDADAVARGVLAERGFEEFFAHSLGHGVGLDVHEKPTLSSRSEDTLEPGTVFTVEPGVYIEGWGGVRIEDMVLMTGEGPRLL